MGHVNGVHEGPQQVHFSKENPGTTVREDPTREIHRRDRRPFVIGTVDKYAVRGTRGPWIRFQRGIVVLEGNTKIGKKKGTFSEGERKIR